MTSAVLLATAASPTTEPNLKTPDDATDRGLDPTSTTIAPEALSTSSVPELLPMPTASALREPLDPVIEMPPPLVVAVERIRVWFSIKIPSSPEAVEP